MMRQFGRAIAFVAAFLAAIATTNLQASPGKVTFTVSGYTGAKTFTNFVVPVRLAENSPAGFSYADVAANGSDIVFYDANDVETPYEIDTWDTTGTSIIWVRLPSMAAGTTFTMEYGIDSTSRATAPTATWAGYGAVFHMADGTDSATGGAVGTFVTPTAASPVAGLFGQSHGSTTDSNTKQGPIMTFPVNDTMLAMAPDGATAAFTVSGWIKKNGDSVWNWLFSDKTADASSGFGVQYRGGTNGAHTDLAVWPYSAKDSEVTAYSGGAALWTTTWSKYDVVFNGTKTTIYINGAAIAGGEKNNYGTRVPKFNANSNFSIGGQDNTSTRALRANVDEFRIRGGVLDADFVKAQYDAEKNASFLSAEYERILDFAIRVTEPAHYDATAGKWKVGVNVLLGTGDIGGKLVDTAGNEIALTPKTGVGVGLHEFELDGIPADTVYDVVITSSCGAETFEYDGGTLFTGTIALTTGNPLSADYGTFVFTRSGSAGEYAFTYTIGGTAVAGTDYEPLSGTVVFADGQSVAKVKVVKIKDAPAAPGATITLTVDNFPSNPLSETIVFADLERSYDVAAFSYNIEFTVGDDVGVDGSGDPIVLDNFPVPVRLSKELFPNLAWGTFTANGANLVFLDAGGHALSHEVEKWATDDTDEALVWVRIPQLSNGTKFTAAWGGVDVEQGDPADTWKDYGGVWHMNGYAQSGNIFVTPDSSGAVSQNEAPMDATTEAEPNIVAGVVGNAYEGNGHLFAPDWAKVYDKDVEVSFWFKIPNQKFTAANQEIGVFSRKVDVAWNNWAGWYINTKSANGHDYNKMLAFVYNSNISDYIDTPEFRSEWCYMQIVISADGTTVDTYLNGELVNTRTDRSNLASDTLTRLCGGDGQLRDEMRIGANRGADWVKAEYASMTQADFVTGSFKSNSGISPTAASVSGNISDGYTLDVTVGGESTGSLSYVIVAPDGSAVTNLITDAAVRGAYSAPLTLAADTCYRIGALTDCGGRLSLLMMEEALYTGDVSISAGDGADAVHGVNGSFTISRAATTAATAYDLVVRYTIGGTAVNGTDFEPLTGVVTIPAGESAVTIDVVPRMHGGSPAGMTLDLDLAEGPYGIAQAAASAGITVDGIGDAWVLSSDGKTITDGDWILNVTVTDGKATVTGIATAGIGTTLRFAWDVMDASGNLYPIRAIGNSAFTGNTVIRLVTFRDDLERIGYAAFQNCTNLGGEYRFGFNGPFVFGTGGSYSDGYNFANSRIEKVEMGEGVATIAKHAFKDNPKLKTVVLPPALDMVPWMCFYGCSGLTTVTPFLPETVTQIGYGAFDGCSSLTGDLQCASVDGFTFGVDKEGTGGGNSDAFRNTKITSATIGNGLTERIPSRAFHGCTALKTVCLPDAFAGNIGWQVFENCTALETVTPLLPYGIVEFGHRVFGGCSKLKGNLVIDGTEPFKFSVNSDKGSQAFSGTQLDSVYFGANVTNVAAQAFIACTTIKEMRFTKIIPVAANAFGNLPEYQAKAYFDRVDPACAAFLADSTKVTPWAELDDATQKLYTDAHPGEKLPLGLTTDATNLRKSWAFGFWSENPGTMIMLK